MNLLSKIEWLGKGLRAANLYRRCVRPGGLCFDIGANTGSRAVIFTLLGARTIALEPNVVLAGRLGRIPRVKVVNKAVASHSGHQKMLFNSNDQISSLNPEWRKKWPEFPEWIERDVECVTLDQLIAEFGRPDFCKIDVEGFESEVLVGLGTAIPFLSFEVAPDFEKNIDDCFSKLGSLGNYHFNFAVGDDFEWLLPRWAGASEVKDMVAQRGAGDVYARLSK